MRQRDAHRIPGWLEVLNLRRHEDQGGMRGKGSKTHMWILEPRPRYAFFTFCPGYYLENVTVLLNFGWFLIKFGPSISIRGTSTDHPCTCECQVCTLTGNRANIPSDSIC